MAIKKNKPSANLGKIVEGIVNQYGKIENPSEREAKCVIDALNHLVFAGFPKTVIVDAQHSCDRYIDGMQLICMFYHAYEKDVNTIVVFKEMAGLCVAKGIRSTIKAAMVDWLAESHIFKGSDFDVDKPTHDNIVVFSMSKKLALPKWFGKPIVQMGRHVETDRYFYHVDNLTETELLDLQAEFRNSIVIEEILSNND